MKLDLQRKPRRADLAKLLAVGLLLGIFTRSVASIMMPLSVEELARTSDSILIGRVVSVGKIPSIEVPIHTVTIEVEQYIKNDLGLSTLDISVLGGSFNDSYMVKVPDEASFEAGERVLLFLTKEYTFHVNGGYQGKYCLENGQAINQDPLRNTSERELLLKIRFILSGIEIDRFDYSKLGYPKLTYETIQDYSPHLANYTVIFRTSTISYYVGDAVAPLKADLDGAVQLVRRHGNLKEDEYSLVSADFSPGLIVNGTLTMHPTWYVNFAHIYGGFWAWDVFRDYSAVDAVVDPLNATVTKFARDDRVPPPTGQPHLLINSSQALRTVRESNVASIPQELLRDGIVQRVEPRIVYMGPNSSFADTTTPLVSEASYKSRLYWVIEFYSPRVGIAGANGFFFVDAETGVLTAAGYQRNFPQLHVTALQLDVNYSSTSGLAVADDHKILMDGSVIDPEARGTISILAKNNVVIKPGEAGTINLTIGWHPWPSEQNTTVTLSLFNPALGLQKIRDNGQPEGLRLEFGRGQIIVLPKGKVNIPLMISADSHAAPATYLVGVKASSVTAFLLTVWDGVGAWPQPRFLVERSIYRIGDLGAATPYIVLGVISVVAVALVTFFARRSGSKMVRTNSFKIVTLGAMLFLALAIGVGSMILTHDATQIVSTPTSSAQTSDLAGFGPAPIPVEALGEPVTLERARQVVGVDFKPPTHLPPGAICEIRATGQWAALIYRVPKLSRIPWYIGDVQIVIGIRDDNTSFSLPPTSEPPQTIFVIQGNVTETYTITPGYLEGPKIVQVNVAGNPGWGFDPTDFPSGRHISGRLEWWVRRIHYSMTAELPLTEMIKIAESMT